MKIATVESRTAISGTHNLSAYRGMASHAAMAATTGSRMMLPRSPRVLAAESPHPDLFAVVSVNGWLLLPPQRAGRPARPGPAAEAAGDRAGSGASSGDGSSGG